MQRETKEASKNVLITASDVEDYFFCPRYLYYQCLEQERRTLEKEMGIGFDENIFETITRQKAAYRKKEFCLWILIFIMLACLLLVCS